jgi:hypothetical protein
MRSTKRARRRSQRQNKIKRALRTYATSMMTGDERRRWATRNYDHLKKCSCWMCGHRRRSEGSTLQERRFLLSLTDESQ